MHNLRFTCKGLWFLLRSFKLQLINQIPVRLIVADSCRSLLVGWFPQGSQVMKSHDHYKKSRPSVRFWQKLIFVRTLKILHYIKSSEECYNNEIPYENIFSKHCEFTTGLMLNYKFKYSIIPTYISEKDYYCNYFGLPDHLNRPLYYLNDGTHSGNWSLPVEYGSTCLDDKSKDNVFKNVLLKDMAPDRGFQVFKVNK